MLMMELLLSYYSNPTVMLSMIKYIVSPSRERERMSRKKEREKRKKDGKREIDTSYAFDGAISATLLLCFE